jgi:hypothetical protein
MVVLDFVVLSLIRIINLEHPDRFLHQLVLEWIGSLLPPLVQLPVSQFVRKVLL